MNRIATITIILMILTVFSPNARAEVFVVDSSHSVVEFSVKHMVIATVKGVFTDFNGTFIYDEKDFQKWKFDGTIKTKSINTNDEKRDTHLRSADFFDVEKFPHITLRSKTIVKKGDTYIGRGDFTLRGVTKELEIPFEIKGPITDPWGNKRLGLEAATKINRQDFGVSWSKSMDTGGLVVGNDVTINLYIEFVEKK